LWTEALVLILVGAGVFFMFVASLGVLRLPDFYSRLHAPTKAATLGLFLLLAATVVAVPKGVVLTKALLALAFLAATAPVGAHILSRAAYRKGVARAPDTDLDEYAPQMAWLRTHPPAPEPVHDVDQERSGETR
jgi:multicomponent Na+:H+ antiporter subunit G